jgi:hypothetical protein
MRHRTTLTAGALVAAMATAVLSGCSSDTSDKSDGPTGTPPPAASAAPTSKAPAKANGHLDYSGAATGSADFTGSVGCEIKDGKLIGLTTPATHTKTPLFPSFIATGAASPTQVALFNTPDKKAYAGRVSKSEGVTGQQNGKTWTVTVKNLQIAQNYGGTGPVITLNGSFTCTELS